MMPSLLLPRIDEMASAAWLPGVADKSNDESDIRWAACQHQACVVIDGKASAFCHLRAGRKWNGAPPVAKSSFLPGLCLALMRRHRRLRLSVLPARRTGQSMSCLPNLVPLRWRRDFSVLLATPRKKTSNAQSSGAKRRWIALEINHRR